MRNAPVVTIGAFHDSNRIATDHAGAVIGIYAQLPKGPLLEGLRC